MARFGGSKGKGKDKGKERSNRPLFRRPSASGVVSLTRLSAGAAHTISVNVITDESRRDDRGPGGANLGALVSDR